MHRMRNCRVFFTTSSAYCRNPIVTGEPYVSADVVGNAYSLLSRRTADWSLDQPFYVDQEVFDLEMQLFFGRQWLFVALACEIPRIGDRYRVVRLPFTGGRSSMTLDGRPACSKLL